MDESGFPLYWDDEDRQMQLAQAGQVIDTPYPEQGFQHRSQPGAPPLNPIAAQAAFAFQQQPFPQYLYQQPHSNIPPSDPQAFLFQNHIDNLLARILASPQTAAHSDSICFYLSLPPDIWATLYKAQSPTPFHHELTGLLSQKHGRPPTEILGLIHQLRERSDFLQAQPHLVNAFITATQQRNPSQTPEGSSASNRQSFAGGRAPDQSGESSPTLYISSPMVGQESRTTATTPLSVGITRTQSRSPYKRTKGRAPRGERYKCPYLNCKHEPFRNAGNFNNHMRSTHAESLYRNQHPSNFLMPDVSPQPSIQGDVSTATSASDSPVNQRRLSREGSAGDLMAVQGLSLGGPSARPNVTDDGASNLSGLSPDDAGSFRFGDFAGFDQQTWDEMMKK